MTKKLTIFFLSLFLSTLSSYAQKSGIYYVSIPSDNTTNCRLKFLSDTTVELSNVARHMSEHLSLTFKYYKSDTAIIIITNNTSDEDKVLLDKFGYKYFYKSNVTLKIIREGYIDFENSFIYVEEKKSKGDYKLAYIIEGKVHLQNMGHTNGYGLVKKAPKRNKQLEKRLKEIANNFEKYDVEFLKGLKAYQKVGLEYIPGVIIINKK